MILTDDLIGAYVSRDTGCVRPGFVRSGKAVGKGGIKDGVLKQHRARARETTGTARFYRAYSDCPTRMGTRGPWSWLKHYQAISFRRGDVAKANESLPISHSHADLARKVKAWTPADMFANMYAYATELIYDLCLDRIARISQNPGWEAVLHEWHSAK